MAAKKKRKYFYDYSLLFAVIFITGFGMIMMYSASGYSAQSQMNDAMYFLRHQAVFAASLAPARAIGVDAFKGSLEAGKDADVWLADEGMNARAVFLRGRRIR